MQAVVDQLLIHYERRGRGPTVLLLHGWGDDLWTFQKIADNLSKDYDIILMDLPGMGSSEPPHDAWGLEQYATCALGLLQKIGLNEVFAVIGHSNGGAVAIIGISNGILKADKLILLASAGVRSPDATKKKLLRFTAKGGKLATKVLPGQTQQRLRQRFYNSIGSELTLLPHMEETFKRIVARDVRSDAKKLKLPTLLIYGHNDEATPWTDGEKLHDAIPKSKFTVLPESGHFIHQEKSAEVTSLLRDFLQQ